MAFLPDERVALFIDGANLYSTARALGFDIEYKRLLKEFQNHGTLVRAFYYTTVIEDQEFSGVRPLLDWLDYNGFTVVTKPTKDFTDANGHRKVKGNMDIELAIDMLELADKIDHAVLFSGDSDFRRLVEATLSMTTILLCIFNNLHFDLHNPMPDSSWEPASPSATRVGVRRPVVFHN